MTAYQDELSNMVRTEREENGATREDWERALELVYGPTPPLLSPKQAQAAINMIERGIDDIEYLVRQDNGDYAEEDLPAIREEIKRARRAMTKITAQYPDS